MIEAVSAQTLPEVLPLIRQYQEFYKIADISDAKNAEFFAQFGEANPAGCQFLYRDNETNRVLGFATVYLTFSSTIAAKVGVLNDLYTLAESRSKGVGRALIEHARQYAAKHGATRLQWVTAPDNSLAQALYNSLDAQQRVWHFYTYSTAHH
ncbi:GNAT family N-acetyltransferase [Sessilibacter sp. MAH2]